MFLNIFKKEKIKSTKNFVFGVSGTGKSFSLIKPDLFGNDLNDFTIFECSNDFSDFKNSDEFVGYFITKNYIEEKSRLKNISVNNLKVFFRILDKHNYSPIGRDFYIKDNVFYMDGLRISFKPFNKDLLINQIIDDFKEDFEVIFDENDFLNKTDIELAEIILSNYKDFYDEDLLFIDNYCYFFDDRFFVNKFSEEIFEKDIFYFINKYKSDHCSDFFKILGDIYIKAISYKFIKNNNIPNLYLKISEIDDFNKYYEFYEPNNKYYKLLNEIPQIYMEKIIKETNLLFNHLAV